MAAESDNARQPLPPGSTIGVFGGGQLGRMLAQAADRLGYRTHVFAPEADCPASQVADLHTQADYTDEAAVRAFADAVDVVTLEFENVPTRAVEIASECAPTRPSARVLRFTQDRLREKQFLVDNGIECAPFAPVTNEEELASAIDEVGLPAVIKTASEGYDGKGQRVVRSAAEARQAWEELGRKRSVWEGFVDFRQELSVLVARSPGGESMVFGPIANRHANHILDVSVVPASGVSPALSQLARETGEKVSVGLQAEGVLCVEFFHTQDDRLLVNEIAPRTHNSGHLTIEACQTSQFSQQVLAICGQPLGSMDLITPAAAMANLLGELWREGEPQAGFLDGKHHVSMHMYGKSSPKPGRKMGHITALGESSEEVCRLVADCRMLLTGSAPEEILDSSLPKG